MLFFEEVYIAIKLMPFTSNQIILMWHRNLNCRSNTYGGSLMWIFTHKFTSIFLSFGRQCFMIETIFPWLFREEWLLISAQKVAWMKQIGIMFEQFSGHCIQMHISHFSRWIFLLECTWISFFYYILTLAIYKGFLKLRPWPNDINF